jgi:uncharacterized membrane protein YgaE (UPF0421/DUF939 family)
MPGSRDVQRAGTRVLSAAMVAVGIAMLAVTLAGGSGPLALGVVLGVLFVAAGAGRLWLARGRG